MAHKSVPRDSCGGTKSCGGNLLAVGTPKAREPFLRRNARAVAELIGAFRASRQMTKDR